MLQRIDRLVKEIEDRRSPFARDRDRVLYCAQFRRLSAVTQVTSPTELHTFHNRLTHTLEVAQIARRIAERFLEDDRDHSKILNADVCETAALAHDLGHPPFGHNGEKTLDELARNNSERDGYEGNAQSLRILTRLAVRKPGQEGLNLTVASLRASVKYPTTRFVENKENKKFGVFSTEKDVFEKIFEGAKPYKTLEAQIMDWSDDIAYSIHDLYDFIMAGVIHLSSLKQSEGSDIRALLSQQDDLGQIPDDAFKNIVFWFDLLPDPILDTTSRFSSDAVAKLKVWVSTLITRYSETALSLSPSKSDLMITKEAENEIHILKALTRHFAINSTALRVRQVGEKKILGEIFAILLEDAKGKQGFFSDFAKARLEVENKPVRSVCDIIASMTDAQATSIYHKLTGITPASVLDITTPSVF
jgi:dGTPase